jgi:4-carboxymuconolactone decarboxylase
MRTRHWPRKRASHPAAIEAIRLGETPNFAQPDEALVHRICTELFEQRRLSDASFAEAIATIGETGLVEVIGTIGYYTLIANTLNVFQVVVPEGASIPFAEP